MDNARCHRKLLLPVASFIKVLRFVFPGPTGFVFYPHFNKKKTWRTLWREKFAFCLLVTEEILIFVLVDEVAIREAAIDFALFGHGKNAHSIRASDERL